jgi:phage terminase Nu1 subunit (DNA packaging protein)
VEVERAGEGAAGLTAEDERELDAGLATLAPGDGAPLVVNKRELAQILGVSLPTIDRMLQDGCPIAEGGSNGVAYKFDVGRVRAWREETAAKKRRVDADRRARIDAEQAKLFGDDELPEIEGAADLSPQARAALVRTRREHLLVLEQMRELVRAADVEAGLAPVFAELQTGILGVPDELQRRFGLTEEATVAMREILEDRLAEAADAADRRLKEVRFAAAA